jgi:hypothetical protein
MPYCTCGNHVSQRYWNVFAVEGTLHRCLECDTISDGPDMSAVR